MLARPSSRIRPSTHSGASGASGSAHSSRRRRRDDSDRGHGQEAGPQREEAAPAGRSPSSDGTAQSSGPSAHGERAVEARVVSQAIHATSGGWS